MREALRSESAPRRRARNPAATPASAVPGPKACGSSGMCSAASSPRRSRLKCWRRESFFFGGGFQTLLRRGCHFLIEARLLTSSVADGRPASLASDACFGHEHRNSLPDGSGPRPPQLRLYGGVSHMGKLFLAGACAVLLAGPAHALAID